MGDEGESGAGVDAEEVAVRAKDAAGGCGGCGKEEVDDAGARDGDRLIRMRQDELGVDGVVLPVQFPHDVDRLTEGEREWGTGGEIRLSFWTP